MQYTCTGKILNLLTNFYMMLKLGNCFQKLKHLGNALSFTCG